MIKVLLISGSPRKKSNTEILLSYCEDRLNKDVSKSIEKISKKVNQG